MQEHSIPCSVLVLTRNAAQTLDRCLKNLAPFAEILVHDANSEDDTVAIAKRYGARVLKQYDTEEKSVRVKDFTEIRLKQRSDAANDWVLYLDSDEELSDGLVEEIGSILASADEKTIVNVPRLPVIEGRVRTHGVFFPEIMPRIHHRKGGCTLKKGKTVHEKYVYDSTFTEITTKNPLLFALPDVRELRSKDLRYITLEMERLRTLHYSVWKYVRWFLLREPLVMLSIMVRIVLNLPRYLFVRDEVPMRHEWRYVWYHWRLLHAAMGEMLGHHGRQVLLYLICGTIANVVDIGLYWILFWLGMWYIAASVVSGVIATATSFLLHKYIVFERTEHMFAHLVRYLLFALFDIAAVAGILFVCVHYIGINEEISKVIANGAVVLWNFFAFKFFVYI